MGLVVAAVQVVHHCQHQVTTGIKNADGRNVPTTGLTGVRERPFRCRGGDAVIATGTGAFVGIEVSSGRVRVDVRVVRADSEHERFQVEAVAVPINL